MKNEYNFFYERDSISIMLTYTFWVIKEGR